MIDAMFFIKHSSAFIPGSFKAFFQSVSPNPEDNGNDFITSF